MIPEIVYRIHHQFFFCTSAVFLDRKKFAFFESFFFFCCYKQANKLESIYCSIWPTTDLPVCSEHVHFFAVQELAFPEVHLNGARTAELLHYSFWDRRELKVTLQCLQYILPFIFHMPLKSRICIGKFFTSVQRIEETGLLESLCCCEIHLYKAM